MTFAPRSIAVAINPEASFGKRRDVGAKVVERLRAAGHEVVGLVAPSAQVLSVRAQEALAAGADSLVVVGGDGMVSLGLNLVAGTDIPLGVIPSGTGNDAARGLGLPVADADDAIDRLISALERTPRRVDAGRVRQSDQDGQDNQDGQDGQRGQIGQIGQNGTTTWFFGAVSAGFDAVVNERANGMTRPRGRHRYTLAILRELATLKSKRFELEIDGIVSEVDALLISVANNRSIGGGMMIAPEADLEDGLLDLFVVTPMSRLAFLRLFPKVFSGSHVGLPVVRLTRVASVALACGSGAIAYADGERVGPLPVHVDVVPGALLVLI